MRISIFGGGIFGITTFLILRKKGLDCYLYEKEKNLLSGATTKNLNRVHLGYHYPRDKETVFQSQKGFDSFTKFYAHSVIKKFDNYYAIAGSSKVTSKKYEKFLKETKLKYVKISPKNFKFKTNHIENIYKVNEPVYSWDLLKKQINNLIGKDKNRIFLKSCVKNIKLKENKYFFEINKKNITSDVVINATYEGCNEISKNVRKASYFEYQVTNIMEISSKKFKSIGFALMDGPFFSFLPMGTKKNKQVLYHVTHSVLKREISNQFKYKWLKNNKKLKKIIKLSNLKTLKDLKKYFPEMDVKKINKNYISSRVLLTKTKKTAKRISYFKESLKNYFEIFSGKVDHSVDIANKIYKKIYKIQN
ncbi:FAD-binding oxidoreductase [Pelagibacteraceae bacterium]|nr:FAD-binding oxidoreductase [Pelagibacteraceae bacterium]